VFVHGNYSVIKTVVIATVAVVLIPKMWNHLCPNSFPHNPYKWTDVPKYRYTYILISIVAYILPVSTSRCQNEKENTLIGCWCESLVNKLAAQPCSFILINNKLLVKVLLLKVGANVSCSELSSGIYCRVK
jgi:hypothetical protein